MNFSHFEYLKEQDRYLSACVKDCIKAERCVRTSPGDTAISARRAIENLFKKQSSIHGIRPQNLADSIRQNCDYLEENSEEVHATADKIRRRGNSVVHPRDIEKIDAATKENIAQAMDIVKSLYSLLCLLYGKPEGHDFDEMQVPFGYYTIKRKVSIHEELGRESFFVSSTPPHSVYYYLQCLSFMDGQELEQRRGEATAIIYDQIRNPGTHVLLPHTEIPLPEESDCRLIAYRVYEDSVLLSELRRPMPLKQALRITLDLISALEDMKRVGIYHRNIYPGCILLNKAEGVYRAYLMNLQTSKIMDSSYTVNAVLAASHDLNLYLPEIPANGSEMPDWEKVDVYALCRVFLYCLHPKLALVKSTAVFEDYLDYDFPASLRKLYKVIFSSGSNLEYLPTLAEVKEVFRREYGEDLYL